MRERGREREMRKRDERERESETATKPSLVSTVMLVIKICLDAIFHLCPINTLHVVG